MATASQAKAPWPIFQSFAGWRPGDLGADAVAGLTLAAIAVPEQMATARLGGFAPQIGFLAIVAGALGFATFGANRWLSVGADSTVTPIFAGSLGLVAAAGTPHYADAAALLALMVGAILALGGVFRLGFIANLLSIPVTTGFLAGIAAHILVSQAPALLGMEPPPGTMIERIAAIAGNLGAANWLCLAIGLGVLAIMILGEKLDPRIPGALIGLGGATALVAAFGLEARGVSTLGAVAGELPSLKLPAASFADVAQLAPIALIVAVVVMVQSAATTRSFVSDPKRGPDVNRDFVGVGAANLVAGCIGGFPVNASPPRTAVVSETGGKSQLSALVCAALVLALAGFGAGLLTHVPHAALAGVLLFVAQRIFRVGAMADVFARSKAEFALIAATMAAIVVLPIQQGVGVGIVLSLLHGIWTTTRARIVEFDRIPGTTVWWPQNPAHAGETAPGVKVVALQAPLSFLNAYDFQAAIQAMAQAPGLELVVIEANAIVEIDYTAAQVLGAIVKRLRDQKIDVAFARLESVRAQRSFAAFGLKALVGKDHLFHSVEEAVRALAPRVATPS